MESDEEIRKLLKDFTAGEIQVFPAVVLSVSREDKTCVVKPGNAPELKARLKSAIDQKESFHVLYPKVESTVLVGLILNDPDTGFVVSFGELDAIECHIGDQSYYLDKDGHVFNAGELGGMTNTPKLVDELDKTNDYLTTLKTATGAIATALDALVPGTSTAFNNAMAGKEVGDFSGIENDKVKH